MTTPSAFGAVLRRERETAGLSVAALAARANVAERTIEYLESGESQQAQRTTRERLARGFGLMGSAEQRFVDGPYDSVIAQSPVRHNLPSPLTAFVVRDAECESLCNLIAGRARRRLVTLCGPGGIGKTRLALAAAMHLRERFPGGVYLIDLALAATDQWIETLLANALEVRDDSPNPIGEMIASRLRHQRTLLIFDNCEHLLAPTAAIIARLLAGAPSLQIIATSRERLGLPGERLWRLAPLALPDSEASFAEIAASPAIRFFVDRVRSAVPDFVLDTENVAPVVAICRRLDGLPLAIELVAPRLIGRSVVTLAAEIATALDTIGAKRRGVHQRQRTIRAAVDWSYALLTDAERVLLRRVAVFPGSWTADAARSVCEDDQTPDLPVLLDSLVEKSLVQKERVESGTDAEPTAARFYFLQTIRHFALDHLEEAGEAAAMNERLCDWAIAVLESVESPLDGGAAAAAWLAQVSVELTSLRAARTWSLEHDPARALRLISATWPYAFARLGHDAGRYLLRLALAAAPGPSPWRMRALQGLGFLELFNDLLAARRHLAEALELAEAAGATAHLRAIRWQLAFACVTAGDLAEADALLARGWPAVASEPRFGQRSPYHIVFGYLAIARGDFATAREELQAADAQAREADQPLFRCIALSRLGALYLRYGHLAIATERYTELLGLARRLGSWFYQVVAQSGLAHVQEWQGELTEAERGYAAALKLAIESGGSRLDRATILLGRGRILLWQGRAAESLALLQEGDLLAHELKHRSLIRDFASPIGFALWDSGQISTGAGQLAAALAANAQGDPTTLARCLEGIALLAIECEAPVDAAGWLDATSVLRDSIGMTPRPTEQAVRDLTARLCAARGEEEPRELPVPLPLDQAIADAIAWLNSVVEHPQSVAAVRRTIATARIKTR